MTLAIQPRAILRAALIASIASLAAAFTAQYGFGLMPCHLCYAQRVPFALVILLSVMGLLKRGWHSWRLRLIAGIGVLFLINSGIAAYHSAVEKHVVSGPSGCTQAPAPEHMTDEEFLKRIQEAPIASCDQPAWDFHGITMAQMNAVWCLLLAIATFVALRHCRRKEKAHA